MGDAALDRLLTEKDLAAWLGISLPTLQRMRSSGSGPRFVQLSSRRVAYRRVDVEAWLAARTIGRIGALCSVDGSIGAAAEVGA
jgi:predicted DNA-binding transcriptional regulator AlpA